MRGGPPPGPLRTLALATLANTVGTGLWLAGGALYLTRDVGLSATTNTVLTVLLAVRLSRGADTAAPAARKLRRAGLVLAAATPLYAVTAALPVLPAVVLLLVATAVWTVGDLWPGNRAPPGSRMTG
ncbi:hypothetical protein [Micromonospora sp. NPDC049240]|uniref:hypothetical protein n=1 Tax=Micromonospora sp. NPDC049240 TaxID=3155151 RepID=UPI0033C77D9B